MAGKVWSLVSCSRKQCGDTGISRVSKGCLFPTCPIAQLPAVGSEVRRDYRPAESLSCSCRLALSAHKIIKEMGAGSNSPVEKGNESRNPSSLIGKQFKFPMSSKMVLGIP